MAFNPSPKVADARDIARKWGKQQVIIISLDHVGTMEMATYGHTAETCNIARIFGTAAWNSIYAMIHKAEAEPDKAAKQN